MANRIDIARKIFSNMPDAVFGMYIGEMIPRIGWPFTTVDSTTYGTEWANVLDHQTIKTIADLEWKLGKIPVPAIRFHPSTKRILVRIINCHVHDIADPGLARINDSRERFFKFREISAKTGRVPAPAILMLDNGLYRILDGNHRVAAICSLENAPRLSIDCWVGS